MDHSGCITKYIYLMVLYDKYHIYNNIWILQHIHIYYILHLIIKNEALWYVHGMIYENFSIDVTWNVFDHIQCITGGNIALYFDDQYILYYHMETHQSSVMGYRYFQSPEYLVGQEWIRAILLYPTNIQLASPNVHHYAKFFAEIGEV